MMKMLTDSLVALGVMVAVYFAVTPLVEGCAKTLRWRSWTSEVHIFWAQTMIVNTVSAVTSVWLAVALSDLYATKELSGIQLSMTTNFISSLVFAFGSFTSASYSWILNLCFYWSRYTVMQGLEDYSKGFWLVIICTGVSSFFTSIAQRRSVRTCRCFDFRLYDCRGVL